MLAEDPHEGVAVERHLAGEHLVEDDAEGVDVGAGVDALPRRLLGRHVVRRAEDHPRPGELGVRAADLGDAEVEDLHEAVVAPATDEEDVVGLQIAVDDAAPVRGGQGRGDLGRDVEHLVGRHRAAADPIGEGLALQVLHHEVGGAVGELPEVADVDDVGVADGRRRLRLANEAAHDLLVAGDLAAEHLHREALVQGGVGREVDHAHAALPQHGLHEVAAIDDRPHQGIDGHVLLVGDLLERLPVVRAEAHLVGEARAASRAIVHRASDPTRSTRWGHSRSRSVVVLAAVSDGRTAGAGRAAEPLHGPQSGRPVPQLEQNFPPGPF